MKKLLPKLMTVLAVSSLLPADAALDIEDLRINKVGGQAGIHFQLRNPDRSSQAGPVMVTVYARPNGSSPWQAIHTWNERTVAGKEQFVREIQPGSDATLNTISQFPNWEARVTVQGPDGKLADLETTYLDSAQR